MLLEKGEEESPGRSEEGEERRREGAMVIACRSFLGYPGPLAVFTLLAVSYRNLSTDVPVPRTAGGSLTVSVLSILMPICP